MKTQNSTPPHINSLAHTIKNSSLLIPHKCNRCGNTEAYAALSSPKCTKCKINLGKGIHFGRMRPQEDSDLGFDLCDTSLTTFGHQPHP